MKLIEIIKKIEIMFPISDGCKWDFNGWQVQAKKKNLEIKNILVTLDVTERVIDEAIKNHVNLIICHHPFVFAKNINDLISKDWKKILLKKLVNNNINVYVLHTNFDKNVNGMNFLIARDLELNNIRYFNQEKLAVLGEYNNIKLSKIIDNLKKYFNFEKVKVICNNIDSIITKVLISAGAGGDIIEKLNKNSDISLFITGEVKWHQELEARDKNIDVVILGHDMEEKFVNFIYNFLVNEIFLNHQNIKIIKYFFEKSFYI